jgi:hypothetical protein
MNAIRALYYRAHGNCQVRDQAIVAWLESAIGRGQIAIIELHERQLPPSPNVPLTFRSVVRSGGLNEGPRRPYAAVVHTLSLSPSEKMTEALLRAMSKLPRERKDAFLRMVLPEALKAMVAIFVFWAGIHAFGVGEAVDVILIGIGYSLVGAAVFEGVETMYEGTKAALAANNDGQLDMAAETMARGITTLGVTTLVLLLTHRGQQSTAGSAAETNETQWRYYVENLKLPFNGMEYQAALWSKLYDDQVFQLAGRDGLITLEGVLARTDFQARYQLLFGDEFVEWAWDMISNKYASELKGRVVLYTDYTGFKEDDSGGMEPILTPELLSVFEIPSVSEVLVKDVYNTRAYRLLTREQLRQRRGASHWE